MGRRKKARTVESPFWPIAKMPLCVDPNDPLDTSGVLDGWDLATYDPSPSQVKALALFEMALQSGDFPLIAEAFDLVSAAKAHRTNWWRRTHGETVVRTLRRVYGVRYGCFHGKGATVESKVGDTFTDTFSRQVWGDLSLILDFWDRQERFYGEPGDYGVMAAVVDYALEQVPGKAKGTRIAIAYPWRYRPAVQKAIQHRMTILEQVADQDREDTRLMNRPDLPKRG